jgi:hypothetical protein
VKNVLKLVFILCVALNGRVLAQTLTGFASLPADTFSPGPTSGQFIAPANGRIPPFIGKQPVQGFSSVLRLSGGDFLVMSDNGFGTKETSPDYVLRLYQIDPDFNRSRRRDPIEIESSITLRDPDRKINFPIVADSALYPNSSIDVDNTIRQRRLLTGADFDIESVRQAPDGTFWFGDEFGPFLLHTDRRGKVLDAPFPLPGVRSPQNPFLGGGTANLPRSKGFEGMAISPNGNTLYPMLEGSLTSDPDQQRLIINEFDLVSKRYTGRQWFYKMDASTASGQAIGDFTTVNERVFLVIERDGFEGAAARFKKIFLVDLTRKDRDGFLIKHEIADLMNIRDPRHLGGQAGDVFTFPFQTIESVIPLSSRTLGVLNDNNYPFSAGRTPGQPDPNEFIIIKLDRPIPLIDDEDDDDDHDD